MRHLLTWLMVFGILAGLNARVLAASSTGQDHSACNHAQSQNCCGGDHEKSTPHESHHHHDESCPPDHHHHCVGCIHHLPLAVENDFIHRLTAPEFSRSVVRPESERAPDGPFPALDKPPLI